MSTSHRAKAARRRLGDEAETFTAAWLTERGATILARAWLHREGELDLVARLDDTLCFVEVRARRTLRQGGPLESVTPAKQRKLMRAALAYLDAHPAEGLALRFDVAALTWREGAWELDYIPGAFEFSLEDA